MTFDQTAERATVESLMLDSCTIQRDPEGVGDDVLDAVTLELVPPIGDASTVYAGPCTIAARKVEGQGRTEGERPTTRQEWNVHVPVSADLPRYGDLLTMTAVHAGGDTSLLNRRFTVTKVGGHTLAVSRPLVVEDEKGVTVR